MNESIIKQFLKPDWRKTLFFLVFASISATVYLYPSSVILEFLRSILFLPFSPISIWLSVIFNTKYSWDSLLIGDLTNLIYSYVLSCMVVSFWSNQNRKKLLKGILIAANILVALHVSFMAYFISEWFINDDIAFTLTENGWLKIAVSRVILFCIVALVITGILFLINRFSFTNILKDKSSKLPLYLALILFSAIVIASVAGGIHFLLTKPYL